MVVLDRAPARWGVAAAAALLAVACNLLLHGSFGAAAHLPFLLAIPVAAALAGRAPAALVLATALGIVLWRNLAGTAALPPGASTSAVLLIYGIVGLVLIAMGDSARARAQGLREAQRARLAHREASDELHALLDIAPVGVAIANDPQCRDVVASPRLRRLLGVGDVANVSYTGGERDRLPYRCLRNGREVPGDDLPMQRAARTGVEIRDEEIDLEYDDGRMLHLLVSAAPLLDGDGKVRGAIGVHTDVTALKAAQRELERVARQKDVFLATLAHELRNPLAPVRYAASLLGRSGSPEVVREMSGVIERQVAQMSHLLEELLDVSRITRNVIQIRNEPVDFAEVVRHEVECARPRALELGLALEAQIDPAWVCGDETRLHQVASNLLSNALKFTPRGGHVRARLATEGDGRVRLEIEDDGIGIPAAQLAQVFELFTQVPRPGPSQGAGLGIGLAVARRLVELHGGRIEAASDGEGRGTRLVVHLPTVDAPAVARKPLVANGESLPQRVLVCDDNVDAADSLAQLLRLHGITVVTAYDGASAQSAFERLQPDVALLDLGLPDIQGDELARWIRARGEGERVTLVAVTGWGQPADRERTTAAGFDHHLVKPVEADRLLALLRTLGAGATVAGS